LKIEPVEESDAAAVVSFSGRVTFDEDHTQRLSTPIDGRVTVMVVKVGDKVKVGQPLLRLSSPQVGQLQSDAQRATQDLTLAEKNAERARKLKVDGAISDKEVAEAEGDLIKAKSAASQATTRLAALNVPASDPTATVTLSAQVAGTVVERNVLVGQEVRQDQTNPLLTITNLDTVWVVADVYEQDLGLVQAGAGVKVHVPAYPGVAFPGTVAHLGDVVETTSRTVKLRCVAPNGDGRLKPEMFAKVELSASGNGKVILVPSQAVLSDSEQERVIVVTDDNVFKLRQIDAGPEKDGKVRVLTGLKAGEKIVTAGALFLKNEIENH
jgi:cobalt-zinc-cadmium efflux system membrane fusion protein